MSDQPQAQLDPLPDPLAVRRAVVERYGARARAALAAQHVDAAAAACCEPAAPAGPRALQFLTLDDDDAGALSCDPADPNCAVEAPVASGADAAFGAVLYAEAELAALPEGAQLASAGCGNPVAIAGLQPGERVLDLGSGGGIDCFLAAQRVGATGAVWGLDMTPEMVQLARHNAETMQLPNVRFRLGEIEDVPFADATFDVVISNCVINLSTDKPRVLAEAFRVLAPGGRFGVSDMVRTRPLTAAEARDAESWAGCVAGALPASEFAQLLVAAGFTDVSLDYEDNERGVASAYITARRPA